MTSVMPSDDPQVINGYTFGFLFTLPEKPLPFLLSTIFSYELKTTHLQKLFPLYKATNTLYVIGPWKLMGDGSGNQCCTNGAHFNDLLAVL